MCSPPIFLCVSNCVVCITNWSATCRARQESRRQTHACWCAPPRTASAIFFLQTIETCRSTLDLAGPFSEIDQGLKFETFDSTLTLFETKVKITCVPSISLDFRIGVWLQHLTRSRKQMHCREMDLICLGMFWEILVEQQYDQVK